MPRSGCAAKWPPSVIPVENAARTAKSGSLKTRSGRRSSSLRTNTSGAERWRTAALIAKAHQEHDTSLFDTLVEIAGSGNSSTINSRILGRWIEKECDRICGGLKLMRAGIRDGNTLWNVIPAAREP